MAEITRQDIRNERTRQVLDRINAEMESWTMEQLPELKTTHRTRQAAEHAFNRLARGRRYLLVPKHTEEELFFLRLFILYALARMPHLHARANDVAEYFSTNYAFEWTQLPITRPAVARARDMILSSAESEFGETPMAAPLAYVYHHAKTLHIRNVSNYGECYARAAALVARHYFYNYQQPWRERLGLHTLSHQ